MAVFTILTDGALTAEISSDICQFIFADSEINDLVICVTMKEYVVSVMLLPVLSVASLNLLQMTLSLYIKPILSFIISACILITSLFWYSPFALPNGAMLLRSGIFFADGINARDAAMIGFGVLLVCTALGIFKFKRTDVLGLEE